MDKIQVARHPFAWSVDQAAASLRRQTELLNAAAARQDVLPLPEKLHFADLLGALRDGLDDFKALRTDVMFLCILYPLAGLGAW